MRWYFFQIEASKKHYVGIKYFMRD